MKKLLAGLAFASAVLLCTSIVVAQKGSPSQAPNLVEIGQRLDDAKAVLREHGGYGEGGFQVSISDKDFALLFCSLDKKQARAAISYSKSKQTVTGMAIIFHPIGSPQKLYQTWIEAKSIRFEDDGSYVVHFSAPAKTGPAPPSQ